jgi:hypothetical protein
MFSIGTSANRLLVIDPNDQLSGYAFNALVKELITEVLTEDSEWNIATKDGSITYNGTGEPMDLGVIGAEVKVIVEWLEQRGVSWKGDHLSISNENGSAGILSVTSDRVSIIFVADDGQLFVRSERFR